VIDLLTETGLGFAAGMLAGMFGVGGGLLFVPALVLVSGLTQLEAQATSLAAMVPVVIVGAWRQRRHGNADLRVAVVVGLASAGGVAGGTAVAKSLPEHLLRTLFAVLLLVVAAQLVWSIRPLSRNAAHRAAAVTGSGRRPRSPAAGESGRSEWS
jgi:uncharacterized membrane protein YfcA